MDSVSPIIVIDIPLSGRPIFIYKNWISNGYLSTHVGNSEKLAEFLKGYENPDEVWPKVLEAIKSGKGTSDENEEYLAELASFAYDYCLNVEVDENMRQKILSSKDAMLAYMYSQLIDNTDSQMYQLIIDSGEAKWALSYCRFIHDDPKMRQVLIDSNDPQWALEYCQWVDKYDMQMRNIILESGNVYYAYRYCRDVMIDEQMRLIILAKGDPEWAWAYCSDVRNDPEMRKVILDSKNSYWALMFCEDVDKDDRQMQELAKKQAVVV